LHWGIQNYTKVRLDAADCKLTMRGQNDFVATPVPSSDGRSCAIQQIILRAQGVP